MYVPKAFAMDEDAAVSFLERNPFGMLVSSTETYPCVTHVPFVFEREKRTLITHVARANPHWKELNGKSVTMVVAGPHAYISPSWYGVKESVPTWNYVAVHVNGVCSVIEDTGALSSLLEHTVRTFEPESDLLFKSEETFYQNMMKAIVGLRIDMTTIVGAAKLSQNKPPEVRRRVVEKLQLSTSPIEQDIAAWMEFIADPSRSS